MIWKPYAPVAHIAKALLLEDVADLQQAFSGTGKSCLDTYDTPIRGAPRD
jgi:hypothetical protein